MVSDLTNIPPAERPDLKKQSVLFATVKGVSLGGTLGGILTLASATFALWKGPKGLKTTAFKQVVNNELLSSMGMLAAIVGVTNAVSAGVRNEERKNVRPYVERLEAERESLVQGIIKNNPTR